MGVSGMEAEALLPGPGPSPTPPGSMAFLNGRSEEPVGVWGRQQAPEEFQHWLRVDFQHCLNPPVKACKVCLSEKLTLPETVLFTNVYITHLFLTFDL